MLRIAYILGLLLIVFSSCKYERNSSKTVPVEATATIAANYKNTAVSLDSLLLALKSDEVKNVYKKQGYITLWHNQDDRDAMLAFIEGVEVDGLLPEDYNLTALKAFEQKVTLTQEESFTYDLLLTESFHKLAQHLFSGKVNPSDVYPDWDLKPKELDVNQLLTKALAEHTIEEVLNSCRPPHEIYRSLQSTLKILKSLPEDDEAEAIVASKNIVLNEADSITILQIKRKLAYWGDLIHGDTISSKYDRRTDAAVKKFQQRHGITPHGKIDSATIAELNVTRQQRIEQVMVNLERWKWLPYSFGDRAILINIPDYQLALLEKNDTIQTHKIIVGKPDRRTPVLVSKFYSIVVNPTWTVPPTIIKEDLTPAALEDPEYFTKNNMTIYDHKGRTIDPYLWDFTKPDSYRYVQGPGPKNALGQIKFNFGNKRNVYLHDTNARKLFQNPYRALSSGCVRVEDPAKLAAWMLKDDKKNKLTEGKIQELINQQATKTISLKKSIHVYQLYWTAWMDSNGLQFRPDIYDLDRALYNKLIMPAASTPEYSSLTDDR